MRIRRSSETSQLKNAMTKIATLEEDIILELLLILFYVFFIQIIGLPSVCLEDQLQIQNLNFRLCSLQCN